jgi:external thioesterase TEII
MIMTKPKLFLLHFAGGNCYSYNFILPKLKNFETIVLELPGRGKRMNEKLVNDFDTAASDIFNQICGKLSDEPFMIYGHSMGSYLALRVTNMLAKIGKFPAYIIVSGNPGPGVNDKKNRYLAHGEDFITELKKLGGVPPELFENKELFDFFEPILRSDFEVAEKNLIEQEPPVQCPIYAIMGDKEEKPDQIGAWANYTQSDFNKEILTGDHFFIYQHAQHIADVIRKCYDKIVLFPN